MNAYLNYFIEANVALLLFLTSYKLLLGGETNFRMLRILLMTGIFASLLFPLIHVGGAQPSPGLSIGKVIPSYWLPEVVVGTETAHTVTSEVSFNFWKYTTLIYSIGFGTLCLLILIQIARLASIIRRSTTYQWQNLQIAESPEDKPTFSFFHFIFIGKADQLSQADKEQIICHESIHATQWHSFDILLINVLQIVFWFNPFISTYKKIFIQLHEFEADARTVENSDVNKYCSLLARVALQSADFRIASHFNNSLTVKRIEMMRTIKHKIKRWKMVAFATMLPGAFFFVACQDQVGEDMIEITKNSTHALIVPANIQERFEQLEKENPDKNYVLLELNETASNKLQSLKQQYGLPKFIEVFKAVEGKPVEGVIQGEAANITLERGTVPAMEGEQTFAILEFNEEASKVAELSQTDKVFTVVEEQPEFAGGYDSMVVFLQRNLRYPVSARQQGMEGTVYVSFIVEKDGAVNDVKVIRGITPETDAETVRVMKMSPAWTPGKHGGEFVRVRFVLPIKFNLSS